MLRLPLAVSPWVRSGIGAVVFYIHDKRATEEQVRLAIIDARASRRAYRVLQTG